MVPSGSSCNDAKASAGFSGQKDAQWTESCYLEPSPALIAGPLIA